MVRPGNALRIIPTPMGWLSWDALEYSVNARPPTPRGIVNVADAPVDGVAYLMRQAGVPITQPAFGSDQIANWLTGPNPLERHWDRSGLYNPR